MVIRLRKNTKLGRNVPTYFKEKDNVPTCSEEKEKRPNLFRREGEMSQLV